MLQFSSRGFARLLFAKPPYIRTKTLSGIEISTKIHVQPKEENPNGLESKQWFMKHKNSEELISPWHDVEIEPSQPGDFHVTGVTEITLSTSQKLEATKGIPFNPVMQDTVLNKNTGQRHHRVYPKPPNFGYGYIPQTWCDDELGGDGDPIDLVDLGWKELKPVLSVSDYLVLGIFGLVDQGELDYKVLAIEVHEAKERGIKSIKDYDRIRPGVLDEVKVWFRDYKTWEGGKANKFTRNGDILPVDEAMEIIKESNLAYNLLKGQKARSDEKGYWMGGKEATQKI